MNRYPGNISAKFIAGIALAAAVTAVQFVYPDWRNDAIAQGYYPPTPPVNDDFDLATLATEPLPFSDSVDTRGATTASDDPNCVGNGPTVWYAYTPSADGPIEGNTFGSNYDTTLSVYTGTRGSLVQIACNDDSVSLQSRVIWEGAAGTTYYLMAGAFGSGRGGNLDLEIKPGPVPATVDVAVKSAQVKPKTGEAAVAFEINFSAPVVVFELDVYLLQRSGRGAVFDQMDKGSLGTQRSISLDLGFEDMFGSKGYVGGPAELCITVQYIDSDFGRIEKDICTDIRLQGSAANGSAGNPGPRGRN